MLREEECLSLSCISKSRGISWFWKSHMHKKFKKTSPKTKKRTKTKWKRDMM
jgi:hypothetical protein